MGRCSPPSTVDERPAERIRSPELRRAHPSGDFPNLFAVALDTLRSRSMKEWLAMAYPMI
jgi:hypothetical protein